MQGRFDNSDPTRNALAIVAEHCFVTTRLSMTNLDETDDITGRNTMNYKRFHWCGEKIWTKATITGIHVVQPENLPFFFSISLDWIKRAMKKRVFTEFFVSIKIESSHYWWIIYPKLLFLVIFFVFFCHVLFVRQPA
eukprot:Lithocolla_globosa_v1_NODE_6292_length_1109_cov_12.823529.p2 type:complete len:137 gc:universal NODE_6292_length_1109_cov_12.823529:547-957(+)